MKVILDTSVIVSGLISPKGPPAKIITHWLNNEFTLLYTKAMLAELEDVLNRAWLHERLSHTPNRVPEFLEAVKLLGQPVKGYVSVVGHIRDPFDEMFLTCAILGSADFLVSGDKDLLTLGKFHQTSILTPTQFLTHILD
jgi:uncharacterized protein